MTCLKIVQENDERFQKSELELDYFWTSKNLNSNLHLYVGVLATESDSPPPWIRQWPRAVQPRSDRIQHDIGMIAHPADSASDWLLAAGCLPDRL